jgi:prolyl-tRNA synthetase
MVHLAEPGKVGWQKYVGRSCCGFKDPAKALEFCMSPTAEELRRLVRAPCDASRSPQLLPLNLFQIQHKSFPRRDEIIKCAGLPCGLREFIMKDGYSVPRRRDAKREYQNMYDAYVRIFRSLWGLDFRAVEADTGAIGAARFRTQSSRCCRVRRRPLIVSCDA